MMAPLGSRATSAQPPVDVESPLVSPGAVRPTGVPAAPPPPPAEPSIATPPGDAGEAGPYQTNEPSTLTSLIQYETSPFHPAELSVHEKTAEVPSRAPPGMTSELSCTRGPPASLRKT